MKTVVKIKPIMPDLQTGNLESVRDIELDVATLLQDMDGSAEVPSRDAVQFRPELFGRSEQEISCLFTNWIASNPDERECIEALLEALRMFGERRLRSS